MSPILCPGKWDSNSAWKRGDAGEQCAWKGSMWGPDVWMNLSKLALRPLRFRWLRIYEAEQSCPDFTAPWTVGLGFATPASLPDTGDDSRSHARCSRQPLLALSHVKMPRFSRVKSFLSWIVPPCQPFSSLLCIYCLSSLSARALFVRLCPPLTHNFRFSHGTWVARNHDLSSGLFLGMTSMFHSAQYRCQVAICKNTPIDIHTHAHTLRGRGREREEREQRATQHERAEQSRAGGPIQDCASLLTHCSHSQKHDPLRLPSLRPSLPSPSCSSPLPF